ncbi:MAG: class C sortase [Acutalibacteraceae bacterium]|nr:class C sortase [Acutalibacteraceae bacterium]
MKKHLFTVIIVCVFLLGLSLLLYPTVSDWWNTFHQSRAVASYIEKVSTMEDDEYNNILNQAREYNSTVADKGIKFRLSDDELKKYESVLNITDSGIMGYVEIPKINCKLPIYHGIDDSVLQVAIGHIAGTSLPVGGESSHCVISGHRGLPSARLFTDIDKLNQGDTFAIHVLDETLYYEVDQIRIVKPEQTENIRITKGEDYCTLVTCTPYGVNSHRLLVRGHRLQNQKDSSVRVTADAIQYEPIIIVPFIALPILIVLIIIFIIRDRRRKRSILGRKIK